MTGNLFKAAAGFNLENMPCPVSILYLNKRDYAGHFVIDTLASPKARFVTLNIRSPIVDFDTLSGMYLAQTVADELVGNYKTGETEKTLNHFLCHPN